MENASLVGLSRQIALQRELDVVANNIANLNTTGFKADNVVFQEYLMPVARANQFRGTDRQRQLRAGPRDLARPQPGPGAADRQSARRRDQRQRLPHGADAARRALHAQRRAADQQPGQLVTSEGLQVLGQNGPIVFQPNDRDISIGIDGTISVREGQNTTDSQRGKLRARELRPAAAAAEGRHLHLHGAGRRDAAGAAPNARVTQGAIEKSNVQQRHGDDAHDRGHPHLHPDRQHAAATRATCAARRSRSSPKSRRLSSMTRRHRPCEPFTPPPPA